MVNKFPFPALRNLISGMQAIQAEIEGKSDDEITGELQSDLLHRVRERA